MTRQLGRCTCGEKLPVDAAHFDFDSYCGVGVHEMCDGTLRTATGFHWWCVCDCHPTILVPLSDDGKRAFATWQNARMGVAGGRDA